MSTRKIAIARAVGVIGATVALVTGVTFASLQSQATLSDNTITSASANLELFDGATFSPTAPGFSITGLAPGQTSAPFNFYFKNAGDVDLSLTVNETGISGTIDPATVTLHFKDTNTNNTNSYTLAALASTQPLSDILPAGAQGDSGTPNHVGNYTVTATLDSGVTTNSLTSTFNLVFTGTQTP